MSSALKHHPPIDHAPAKPNVFVRFTGKYEKYCIRGGPQYNAGESASVSEEEAAHLVKLGAAVRLDEPTGAASGDEKALAHPNHDKMVHATHNK